MSNKIKTPKNKEFKMTVEGSLGLLAYGDIGLREWKKFRDQARQIKDIDEEK